MIGRCNCSQAKIKHPFITLVPEPDVTYIEGISTITINLLKQIALAISNETNITLLTNDIYVHYKRLFWHISIGNQINIVLTNNIVQTFKIIGFNHDLLTDQSLSLTGRAGITLETLNFFNNDMTTAFDSGQNSLYKESDLNIKLQDQIYNLIPLEWKNNICSISKKVMSVYKSAVNDISQTISLCSVKEILGNPVNSLDEGQQYLYYKSHSVIKYKQNDTAVTYLTRSVSTNTSQQSASITSQGTGNIVWMGDANCFPILFCI